MRNATLTLVLLLLSISTLTVSAQSTTFTYQGSLSDGANPANGNYDFEFRLYAAASGGFPLLPTITANNVAVANGIFSVSLDFGSQFPGADRFLEIRVKPSGGGSLTTLAPRQPVNSSPYSIKSLTAETATSATNATQLGGVAANQYVITTDPRMTDARAPTANSTNYIQNRTTLQSGNFYINGNGTAGTLLANFVTATNQFKLGTSHILSADVSNLFAGSTSGLSNTTGGNNSFFGQNVGLDNTTGSFNSIFGSSAGGRITTGSNNSFFGYVAGNNNTTGTENAFFGMASGNLNTTGGANAFFGRNAGNTNTTGSNNTNIGKDADVSTNNLSYATAIGSGSIVSTNNTVRLGRTNDFVSAPGTMVVGNSTVRRGTLSLYSNSGNSDLYMQTPGSTSGINIGVDSGPTLYISHFDGTTYLNRLIITSTGTVRLTALGSAGNIAMCRNSSGEFATCSSSMRYKKNIGRFSQGLSFVNKLRPITFDWKDGGMKDVGFGAEEIAKIDDRFVTYNDKGEVEGVKYDRLSVAFVNSFKEQQAQIETQQAQIESQTKKAETQQRQIDELRTLVCELKPSAKMCLQ